MILGVRAPNFCRRGGPQDQASIIEKVVEAEGTRESVNCLVVNSKGTIKSYQEEIDSVTRRWVILSLRRAMDNLRVGSS